MRLSGIRVADLFSFQEFAWSDIDEHLNLIVGPNSAGKTNLFRAFQVVVQALGSYSTVDSVPALLEDAERQTFTVSLDLTFDTEVEQDLLRTYIAASLVDAPELRAWDRVDRQRLADTVERLITRTQVAWLFRGCLTVKHFGEGRVRSNYASLAAPVHHVQLLGDQQYSVLWSAPGPHDSTLSTHENWLPDFGPDHQTILSQLDSFSADGAADTVLHGWLSQLPGGYALGPQRSQQLLSTHHAFEERWGEPLDYNTPLGIAPLMQRLLRDGFVFIDNVRRAPRLHVATVELHSGRPDTSSGENLAAHLFRLKNGSRKDRVEYARVESTFKRLMGSTFDVGLAINRTASRSAPENQSMVGLTITIADRARDRPLERSGAGTQEALLLSAVLASEKGHILLLDEPASNLSANVQSTLATELMKQHGNQVFAVTHSAAVVLPSELARVSRFYRGESGTERVSLRPEAMDVHRRAALEKELRRSADARGLLFSRATILVEGETELAALPVWYAKHFGRPPEADNIVFHCVGGDTGFGTYLLFLQQFRVPWVVVCDGIAIAQTGGKGIVKQLRDAGIADDFDNGGITEFNARRQALEAYGVFSVATAPSGEGENFEGMPVLRSMEMSAREAVGDSKARRGRFIAEESGCPPEVEALLSKIESKLSIGLPLS